MSIAHVLEDTPSLSVMLFRYYIVFVKSDIKNIFISDI